MPLYVFRGAVVEAVPADQMVMLEVRTEFWASVRNGMKAT